MEVDDITIRETPDILHDDIREDFSACSSDNRRPDFKKTETTGNVL